MSGITVRSPTRSQISVTQGNQGSGSQLVIKKDGALNLQSLNNVDSTSLQDGHTIVYDVTTGNWVTQFVDADAIALVDGGTY